MGDINMPSLPYVMPNFTSPLGALQYVNTITGDLFGVVIVLAAWTLVFMSQSHAKPQQSLTVASFVATGFAALLWAAGVVGLTPLVAAILALICSVAYLFFVPVSNY